eukprot:CAMPEP_0177688550 /NCGR_PEP_ID=MMETSP0447-20121125/34714_1 /TAXON_ID=0 /ORGANISM="Stygamoeba regulata, Strain BSH-02190019" /LENGTH=115 /DNA_ID=CAMNT_0019198851 /DNA_START=95 /DNA_END=442 /DNA_ORIENTATION=-
MAMLQLVENVDRSSFDQLIEASLVCVPLTILDVYVDRCLLTGRLSRMSQSETTSKHFDGEVAAFFRKLLEDTKEDSTDIDHEVRTGEESNLCAYNFGFATEQLVPHDALARCASQ